MWMNKVALFFKVACLMWSFCYRNALKRRIIKGGQIYMWSFNIQNYHIVIQDHWKKSGKRPTRNQRWTARSKHNAYNLHLRLFFLTDSPKPLLQLALLGNKLPIHCAHLHSIASLCFVFSCISSLSELSYSFIF